MDNLSNSAVLFDIPDSIDLSDLSDLSDLTNLPENMIVSRCKYGAVDIFKKFTDDLYIGAICLDSSPCMHNVIFKDNIEIMGTYKIIEYFKENQLAPPEHFLRGLALHKQRHPTVNRYLKITENLIVSRTCLISSEQKDSEVFPNCRHRVILDNAKQIMSIDDIMKYCQELQVKPPVHFAKHS